jgi:hypothetical protein
MNPATKEILEVNLLEEQKLNSSEARNN